MAEEYHPYGTTSYQAMKTSLGPTTKRYRFVGGFKKEEGGISDLFGDNKNPLFSAAVDIKLDKNGNFLGVIGEEDGKEKLFSIDQWNNKMLQGWNSDKQENQSIENSTKQK